MLLRKIIEIIELCKKREGYKAKKIINKFAHFLSNNLEVKIINYSINSLENKKNKLLKNCKAIIDLQPEISFSYINMWNYYKNSKNYKKAHSFYLKSLKKDKSYFDLLYQKKSFLSFIKSIKKNQII